MWTRYGRSSSLTTTTGSTSGSTCQSGSRLPEPEDTVEAIASLFLDGNHTWIVDYRWAGAGDPFDDLGSIAAHLSLSDDRCDAMLALYFGGVDSARRSHLALMRLAAEYLAGIRELVGASSTSAIGAAERRFASLVETASDPRFDAWLGIASPSP